jgi:hypothetical protein
MLSAKRASSLRDLVEEIELADAVGLGVFGLGEHHRPDYAVSSPAVVLAAAAIPTKNSILSSAVTVLSSDDPVCVFQYFATLDQLTSGRPAHPGSPKSPVSPDRSCYLNRTYHVLSTDSGGRLDGRVRRGPIVDSDNTSKPKGRAI